MKKFLFVLVSLVMSVSTYGKISELQIKQDSEFQLINIVELDNVSASILFDNTRIGLSKLTNDSKSESVIDYANFDTKTIVIKTKLYIGAGKNRPLTNYHWDVYLHVMTTIKIKDNKVKVISDFKDFEWVWNVSKENFTLPFYECYPSWNMNDKNKKKQYGVNNYASWESAFEKAIQPNTETSIIMYQFNICKIIDNIFVEEDF